MEFFSELDVPIHPVDTGDLDFSFDFAVLSGFPRFAASRFAYFSFALRCCGVCAFIRED